MTPTDRLYLRLPWPTGRATDVFLLVVGHEHAIVAAYRAGESLRVLAARYGVTAPTMGGIVLAFGVRLRGRGGNNNPQGLGGWRRRR